MGDMTKEPSMEEILSSIKRIISEEGDEAARAATARSPRRSRDTTPVPVVAPVDEVLELTDEIDLSDDVEIDSPFGAAPAPQDAPEAAATVPLSPEPVVSAPAPTIAPESTQPDAMLSVESEVATRHSLSSLTSMMVKPQDNAGDNTLEGLVRELLRPMMKQWLDANLPDLVEAMVAREISRITGRAL